MSEPASRRYAHSEGRTFICFDSKMRVVTCGHDCDVRILEGDESTEFSVSSDKLSAIACYHGSSGFDVVAVGMDDHSVQSFQLDGTPEGLLMRFTGPVTYLAVNGNHSLLAAGTSEFNIKVVETADSGKGYTLIGHEAPVLCVSFDPKGELLASSSCDGRVKIWSLKTKECVETLPVLHKSNSVNSAKSLVVLSWRPTDGKMIAVPVGSEIKLYDRLSWKCMFSLGDDHHKEPVNVVSWSPCGAYLASGGTDGAVCLWDVNSRLVYSKLKNEISIGITSMEWDPRGHGAQDGKQVLFGDSEGYIGVFENVYPNNKKSSGVAAVTDTLADDSLLMEGIPPDDIFDDFDDADLDIGSSDANKQNAHGDDDSMVQSRKRQRIESDEGTPPPSDLFDDGSSFQSGIRESVDRELGNQITSLPRKVMEFNEKLVQVIQSPLQPSSTPDHLQHRFMVYNLVGVIRCHSDESTSMVEVDFHNTGTHHSFSLANYSGYNMAALSERALVLACERADDQPSQLQCTHFSSWDSNKEWTISLPQKESILSITIGDSWIAIATNKLMLRLFTVGGVQREVLSLPGPVVTVAGWGSRLAIVYQTGLGTSGVFSLTVWVLDVQRKKELHPPHSLPLSHGASLEWIGQIRIKQSNGLVISVGWGNGSRIVVLPDIMAHCRFSEEGVFVSYDSKGMVRILSSCYGKSSWVPVLDTNKQLGSKSDHYFIVGMTHNPDELRAILCKGLNYPPVHPKPVMSTLSLKLPLCEVNTEKSQLEDACIQMTMIRPPSFSSEHTETIQQLMKLFALSCKSDREYRAFEIATMLPDEHSMNLALTYASRTQHLRLARQISELIQQKSMTAEFYSDEDEDNNFSHSDGTDQNPVKNDLDYARNRSEKLKGRIRAPAEIPKTILQNMSRTTTSKFSNKDTRDQRKKCEDDLGNENVLTVNTTKELFSDDAQSDAEVVDGAESDVDVVVDGAESDVGVEGSPTHTAPFFTPESETRHNPFKVAPISKKVQLDRKAGFLDNISTRMTESQQKKTSKSGKSREKSKVGPAAKKSKLAVASKKSTVQSSLKGSFFTSKASDHSIVPNFPTTTPTPEETVTDETSANSGSHVDCNGEDKTVVTTREKLLSFAYNN